MIGTIAAWLERRASGAGGPAFIDATDGSGLGWSDLAASARYWGELAADRGLGASARVALVIEDPLSFVSAWFGALASGLAVVPVDPRAPAAEVGRTLARARVRVLATDLAALQLPVEETTALEHWWVDRKHVALLEPAGGPPPATCALAFSALLMSSGTTGAPKGIPLAEHQLVAAARRIAAHHRLTPRDRGYSPLPLFHVNAQVVGLLTALASGASLVVERRFDPERYWQAVEEYRPTWLNTVPAVIGALNRRPAPAGLGVSAVRFARSASSVLPVDTLHRFEELTGIGVLETYGMTEAASQVTANPLDPLARRPGSVGLPVGLELRVVADPRTGPAQDEARGDEWGLDDAGLRPIRQGSDPRVLAAGELGVVQLRGAAVVEHYLVERNGREETARARTLDGWLITGDAGSLDEDGYLFLAGRTDDVINRGGEKFHPREVEEILLAHPRVAAAAVVPEPHPRLGQVPVAFVELAGSLAGAVPAGGESAESESAEPQSSEPQSSEPQSSQPQSSEPQSSQPQSSEPQSSEPQSSEPVLAALRVACEAGVAPLKRPVRIEVLDRLPAGPSGKVLRRRLRELLAERSGTGGTGAPPPA